MDRFAGVVSFLKTRNLRLAVVISIGMGVYSLLAVFKERIPATTMFADMPHDTHAVLSLVLGLLLVFRTNTAYDRWYEARRLLGRLVSESWLLMIKLEHFAHLNAEEKSELHKLLLGFVDATRMHLTDHAQLKTTPGFESSAVDPRCTPTYLNSMLYKQIRQWYEAGRIKDSVLFILDKQLNEYLGIFGTCWRIKTTPIPISYRYFIRQCIFLYLLMLPWAIVEDYQVWAAPVTIFLTYFMVGLEVIASSVEDPFNDLEDDIDLVQLQSAADWTLDDLRQNQP